MLTNNYIFRKFRCGLSREETAFILSKDLRYISKLDRGKEIRPEYKRLMRLYSNRELGDKWSGFEFVGDRLKTPDGLLVTPEQVLIGLALLQMESPTDVIQSTRLIRIARKIASIQLLNSQF